MGDSKEAHFATHLTHQFNLVDQQVQAGLYVIKRTSAFLRKIVMHHLEAAAALEKATKNEATKVTALQKDGMAGHVNGVIQLQAIFGSIIQKHKDFANRVTKEVCDPLGEFMKTGEKKRSDIAKKESRASGKLNTVFTKVKTQRLKAQKKWDEIQKMHKALGGMEEFSAKKSKQDKELKKNLDQAAQLFKQYEQFTDEAYAAAQGYFTSEIPELLNEMEALEKERLQLLKQHLILFAKIYSEWDKPSSPGNHYLEFLEKLDIKQDVQKCIVDRVSEVGMPQGPPELPPPLPCKSVDFSTGDWVNPQTPSAKPYPQAKGGAAPAAAGGASPPSPVKAPPAAAAAAAPAAAPAVPVIPPAPDMHGEEKSETPDGASAPASPVKADDEVSPADDGKVDEGPVQYCKGIYDYQTDHSDDLQFKVGDVIRLLSPNVEFATHDPNNPVWLLGELVSNPEKSGSFPSNYVEQCDSEGK